MKLESNLVLINVILILTLISLYLTGMYKHACMCALLSIYMINSSQYTCWVTCACWSVKKRSE